MEALWAPVNLAKKGCGRPQRSQSPRETFDSVQYGGNVAKSSNIPQSSQSFTNSLRSAIVDDSTCASLESVHSFTKVDRRRFLGKLPRPKTILYGPVHDVRSTTDRVCESMQSFIGDDLSTHFDPPCSLSSSRVRVDQNGQFRKTKSFNLGRREKKTRGGGAICSVEIGVVSEVTLEPPATTLPVGLQSSEYAEASTLHRTEHTGKKLTGAKSFFPAQSTVLDTQELTEVSPFRPGLLVECFEIEGGSVLSGEVQISGAKNSALAVLAGAICSEGELYLRMIPDLHDIRRMCQVLQSIGVKVRRTSSGIFVDARDLTSVEPCAEAVRKLRASFFVIGALVGRKGEAIVPLPGGCNIGARPIDLHVRGLEALGAEVEIRQGKVHARALNGKNLVGGNFCLDYPSVGATETLMMAAALAEGNTTLSNVAQEPEVVDLADFLISCGASIQGAGTNTLNITGRRKLYGTEYQIIPDRIEAGTFLIAAAITRSTISMSPVVPKHLASVMGKLRSIGCRIQQTRWNALRINSSQLLQNCDVRTLPYPGFPTDLQPQLMSLLTTCSGQSVLEETVFESRMRHVEELQKLGSKVKVSRNIAIISGKDMGRIMSPKVRAHQRSVEIYGSLSLPCMMKGEVLLIVTDSHKVTTALCFLGRGLTTISSLYGAPVLATDLRAGAALVLAGMAAEGTTHIEGISHIDRGYERLDQKLGLLGASIQRLPCLPSELTL